MDPHPFAKAFAAQDVDALMSLCADDVIYHSPFVLDPGFKGHGPVRTIMTVAVDALRETEYTHDLGDDRSHILVANSRTGEVPVKTTMLFEYNDAGQIREFWFMMRPLQAITELAGAIGRAAQPLDPELLELSKPLDEAAQQFARSGARVIGMVNSTRS